MGVSNHQGTAALVPGVSVPFQVRVDLGLERDGEHPLGAAPTDLIECEGELLASLVLGDYPEHRRTTSSRRRHHAGSSDQGSTGGYATPITRSRIHNFRSYLPEHWVRTEVVEIKPDGFGRYLHPGGTCEFYFEYDRATEARGALTRKLEGYLKLAAGWTREQELTGFPNVLVLVPQEEREGEVTTAFHSATTSLHVSGLIASSFPLYVTSEDLLTERGVLGPVWKLVPADGERVALTELPARSRDHYRTTRCLGRYFTDADPSHRRRISPASVTPQFRALPPRHAP